MVVVSAPTLTVKCAFTTNPAATPTWVDISSYVQGFSSKRGRQFELDQMSTGRGAVILNNQSRLFDPNFTTGTYYNNLKRMRRMWIYATFGGVDYDVFSGYVEKWPQTWEATGRLARVPVPLVDGFAVLALAKLNASYAEELTSERVNDVLTDIGWGTGQGWVLDSASFSLLGTTTVLAPAGDREVGEGVSTIQAVTLSDTTALSHLLAVGDNEQGRFFMGANGAVVFQGRHRSFKWPYTVSQYTFGDGGGSELPYAELELDDDTWVWNDIEMQRVGGALQAASDATSQLNYFVRTKQDTSLLVAADSEVLDRANWTLYRYKQPGTRIRSMLLKPDRDPSNLWPAVLSLAIGDRVTVNRLPPGGGNTISQESHIEGIEHDYSGPTWNVRLWLSPADAIYWQLDDTVASVLGTTTRLAY